MTATTPELLETDILEARATRSTLRSLLRSKQGLFALIALAVVAVAVFIVPLFLPFSADDIDATQVLAGPSGQHLLGGDIVGRDVLARLLIGGQTNILGALLALAVSLVVGVPTGLIAGYFRGWFDNVASWVTDLVIAVPAIIVLLAVSSIVGPSVWISMSVFGVILAPSYFRLVRASVMSVRNELYVDAARVSGLGNPSIIGRHVLAVVRGPIIVQSAFVLGIGIAIQAGLEFIGLGDPTTPSWGVMLNQAFANIYRAPQLLYPPIVAITLTTVLLALLANALRDVLAGDASGGRRRRRKALQPITTTERDTAPTRADAALQQEATESFDTLLDVRDLTVAYRDGDTEREVVSGVTLSLSRGTVLGLVGESGSGKTQTAFSILGLLGEGGRVSGGSIVFDGEDLRKTTPKRYRDIRGGRIGYVPQEPLSNLAPSFTIETQLTEPLRVHLGLSRADARSRARDLLDRVGIVNPDRVLSSYPHQISGGMAQRILIAGAVACEPELLIADEPTTALDVTTQAEVLELLRDLQQERSMGLLLVTHNFGVVADICDDVAVMHRGRIVEHAPTAVLFADPRNEYTKHLLGSTLDGRAPRRPYQQPGISQGAIHVD